VRTCPRTRDATSLTNVMGGRKAARNKRVDCLSVGVGRAAAEKAAAALAVQIPPAHRPWHEFMRALYKHPYSLEFVYLRHVDSGANTFDPYDLQIVAYKDKGERYYTMSTSGVTLHSAHIK
jgi:hypothetical protein